MASQLWLQIKKKKKPSSQTWKSRNMTPLFQLVFLSALVLPSSWEILSSSVPIWFIEIALWRDHSSHDASQRAAGRDPWLFSSHYYIIPFIPRPLAGCQREDYYFTKFHETWTKGGINNFFSFSLTLQDGFFSPTFSLNAIFRWLVSTSEYDRGLLGLGRGMRSTDCSTNYMSIQYSWVGPRPSSNSAFVLISAAHL